MRNINEMSLKELAEYAVTLDRWEWMPGMTFKVSEARIWRVADSSCAENLALFLSNGCAVDVKQALAPDLKDPATVGCVMAMVRKKYGKHAFVRYSVSFDEWCVGTSADILVYEMPTEAHALIAALAKVNP
jgi:hypothetical protein